MKFAPLARSCGGAGVNATCHATARPWLMADKWHVRAHDAVVRQHFFAPGQPCCCNRFNSTSMQSRRGRLPGSLPDRLCARMVKISRTWNSALGRDHLRSPWRTSFLPLLPRATAHSAGRLRALPGAHGVAFPRHMHAPCGGSDAAGALSPAGPDALFSADAERDIRAPTLQIIGTRDVGLDGEHRGRREAFDALGRGCDALPAATSVPARAPPKLASPSAAPRRPPSAWAAASPHAASHPGPASSSALPAPPAWSVRLPQ